MKLCQLIALIGGKKPQTSKEITAVYHRFQKPALFQGLSKRYVPKDLENGEKFPDEAQRVQFQVPGCIAEVQKALVNLWDLVLTQDTANMTVKVDVVVGGKTVLAQVPVTHLLWLEKQLIDLRTALSEIPTLDPQEKWSQDPNAGCFASEKTFSNKTKKVQKVLVKYEATKEHPAQTEMVSEDVTVGQWEQIKYSGAISLTEKNAMLERLSALLDGVVSAREAANTAEAPEQNEGEKIFNFILGKA